jgi:hypothetical protein
MSGHASGTGWWQAPDGQWYPPESHPDAVQSAPGAVRFACRADVDAYCPADVSVRQSGLFVVGPPTVVAAAVVGRMIGLQNARKKARRLAKAQWRKMGHSDVSLSSDRMTVALQGQRYEVPYATVTGWSTGRRGLEVHRVKWAPLRIRARDQASLESWFSELSGGRTWQPPIAETVQVERQITGWNQQSPSFTFGCPAGWEYADPSWMAAVSAESGGAGRAVAAMRNGLDPAIAWTVLVLEIPATDELNPALVEQAADDVAAQLASAMHAEVVGRTKVVSVGGERGIVMRTCRSVFDSIDVEHIWLSHGNRFYDISYVSCPAIAGDGLYDRFLPDFHTMIASWQWYG